MSRLMRILFGGITVGLVAVLLTPEPAQANQFQKSAFISGARLGYAAYANTDHDRSRRRMREVLQDALNRSSALEQGLVTTNGQRPSSRYIQDYRARLRHALNDGPDYRHVGHDGLRQTYIAAMRSGPLHREDGTRSSCDVHVFHMGYSMGVLLALTADPAAIQAARHGRNIKRDGWHFFKFADKWDAGGGNNRGDQCPYVRESEFRSLSIGQFRGREIPISRETNLMARRDFDRIVQLVARAETEGRHHGGYNRPGGGYGWDRSDGRYWDRDWDRDDDNGRSDDWNWSRDWDWNSDQNRYGDWSRNWDDRRDDDRDHRNGKRGDDDARRFNDPKRQGMLIDQCLHWGRECGKPAADHFCRLNNYRQAANFDVKRNRPTWVMGDKRKCDAGYCASFTHITCTKERD